MNMYEVCAKCGHVGKNNYVDVIFAVRATSGKEAARVARAFPRVKHHHKDAIRYVVQIDEVRYWEIRKANNSNPYFLCHNIQEQRRTCEITPICDTRFITVEGPKNAQKKKFYEGKREIKKPNRYYRNYEGRLSA